jgi:hypothetical protein
MPFSRRISTASCGEIVARFNILSLLFRLSLFYKAQVFVSFLRWMTAETADSKRFLASGGFRLPFRIIETYVFVQPSSAATSSYVTLLLCIFPIRSPVHFSGNIVSSLSV